MGLQVISSLECAIAMIRVPFEMQFLKTVDCVDFRGGMLAGLRFGRELFGCMVFSHYVGEVCPDRLCTGRGEYGFPWSCNRSDCLVGVSCWGLFEDTPDTLLTQGASHAESPRPAM
jgi:hypothetical protein